jgi:hypothetical protein
MIPEKLGSLGGLLAIALLASTCASTGKSWWTQGDQQGSWGVELLVNGSPVRVFEHGGNSWVEGRSGERFVLRVHNRTDKRIEVVVAVDGRDVIDGRPADTDKRGYVIGAWSWVDIDGWRTNMSSVAAFRFTHPNDAYATRMGDASELGVVKVAVFEEDRPEPIQYPLTMAEKSSRSAPGRLGQAAADEGRAGLGTRFGEHRQSAAQGTTFDRASSSPVARLQLRYDHADGLCEAGLVAFCRGRPGPIQPEQTHRDFSQPPPDWDGYRPW